ncbi:MAG: cell division protein ZapA [Prevotella sp.]|nr:cell division protein ZapA [Prevotella sp.]MBR5689481.1 cell division protein ZapA [Prevotella sp.]MBR6456169.1 cell division protein ZapA [Prevotella sp.]MBR6494452.1 cell division protein ZapA [Prevotella sp.]
MAEGNKKLNIRLNLYDTDMAVKVFPEEEEYYRNAAKLITNTMNTYVPILRGKKSEKEIMYAAMLDIALMYEKDNTGSYSDILEQLTSEIEEALKND